jgi:hypothetical protein
MSPDQFAEMVDYIEDRFGSGRMSAWSAVEALKADYAPLDPEHVWAALLAKLDSDPKAEWPPTPPALRAAALERMRHDPPEQLPETTERYSWREHSQRTYGEVIPITEALERRVKELHK